MRFGLQNEVVIKKLKCTLKKKLGSYQGNLFITQHYLCFHSKANFGYTMTVGGISGVVSNFLI